MAVSPYEVYVLFENISIVGKYISNLYTASDVVGEDLALPSNSTTYTLPGSSERDRKEAYEIKDMIVVGTPTDTKYLQIWLNDKDTSDVVVLGVNTGTTVNRQFEKMEYIIGEGTPVKFKQK